MSKKDREYVPLRIRDFPISRGELIDALRTAACYDRAGELAPILADVLDGKLK